MNRECGGSKGLEPTRGCSNGELQSPLEREEELWILHEFLGQKTVGVQGHVVVPSGWPS